MLERHFWRQAILGDVGDSLFVTGAIFKDVLGCPLSWPAQHLVMLECHFCGRRDVVVSLFVAGAIFGDVLGCPLSWPAQHLVMLECHFCGRRDVVVSLFVAGAIFGDVAMSLFVGGTIVGDVAVSLFVPGGIFEEIWVDSESAKWVFEIKMRCWGRKISSANGRVQFCNFMVGSWSNRPPL